MAYRLVSCTSYIFQILVYSGFDRVGLLLVQFVTRTVTDQMETQMFSSVAILVHFQESWSKRCIF